ncbi:MAG TPA: hypothetical protein VD813_13375, partial [Pseudonocardia sp.]|nr:hypothetical protein [Pseudonocardia sp.]
MAKGRHGRAVSARSKDHRDRRGVSFVAEAHADIERRRSRPGPRRRPGFHGSGAERRLWDHKGRCYALRRDAVPDAEVPALLEGATVVALDPCGCYGTCPLEWVRGEALDELRTAGGVRADGTVGE